MVSEPSSMTAGLDTEIARVLADVPGWLTFRQAMALGRMAHEAGSKARILEIGSYQGRSTISLALGAAADATVVAVDPFLGNEVGPRASDLSQGMPDGDREAFLANLARAGVTGKVTHLPLRSSDVPSVKATGARLVFIDGSHRFRDVAGDLRAASEWLLPGGRLAVHDAYYSVEVTAALLVEVAVRNTFGYCGRIGSLAVYRKEPLQGAALLVNTCVQGLGLFTLGRVCLRKTWLLFRARLGQKVDLVAEWPL
ncbi:class I SAM-dependent methyltransferase [Streptacidiphilus sp. EB129]|uniref:class I SAM-dependent methyltransferase n=1 Tax=Streptacidiphilus sp. EB129 TaxID=3156262 RepID=UPI003511951C